ncbi:MAG: HAMP domain-containing sensor histidine kinase [Candidatus Baltobacteraceae bacterium]
MRTVIHEMRNQLAVAVANIEAFIDGKFEPSHERLTAVLQALNELDVLMNDLRSSASPVGMRSRFESINVCELIRNEATAMEAKAEEKGVQLSIVRCAHPVPGCLEFYGDPVRIGQILKNVMLNAIRYTPTGRSIVIDCHRESDQVVFQVSDEGPGIPAQEFGRIFEDGFRGDAAAELPGSGIGLSLVKSLVEEHGGSIDVESVPGHGATFMVRLPGTVGGGASGENGSPSCKVCAGPCRH